MTLSQRARVVGVGRQGPRSKAAPLADDIDAVENLLLLCDEHHRIVDNNSRNYSVEVLAKYKADHEAKMAPRKLRPVPPPLDTDTVDLSLLSVSDLPGALWRAKFQFRTAAEVGEHLPQSNDEQVLSFVLIKGESWDMRNWRPRSHQHRRQPSLALPHLIGKFQKRLTTCSPSNSMCATSDGP